MGRTRKQVVSALIAILVLASLLSVAQDREYWPISQYPMYAGKWPETLRRLRIYGITEDGEQRLKARESWGLSNAWLSIALVRYARNPAFSGRLELAVGDLLAEYERRRRAGLHEGPLLYGLRVYKASWQLLPRAENKDRPDDLDLELEVRPEPL